MLNIPSITNVNSYRDLSFTQVGELKKLSAYFSAPGFDVTDKTDPIQQRIYQLKDVVKTIDDSLKQKRSFGRVFLDLITFQFIKRIILNNALPAIKTVITTLAVEVYNEKSHFNPPATKPIATPSYGPNAFEPLQDKAFPKIRTITYTDFELITWSYPGLFQGNHPKNTQFSVFDLIWDAYSKGTLFAAANPQFADQADFIKKSMQVIINALDTKGSEPTMKQKGIAERLDRAFRQCQAVQMRVIQEITTELLSSGNISDEICIWWQEYKMSKLEELIAEKHPNSMNPNEADFTKQFDHIKSAYIEALGKEFGLKGVDAARRDIHRPQNLYFNNALRAEYQKKLDLVDFARMIALDINNVKDETSRLEKRLLNEWYLAGNCDDNFAWYDDSKNYAGLAEPNEAQKDGFKYYISTEEVITLLKNEKVCIAA